jgi:hypothetical protein
MISTLRRLSLLVMVWFASCNPASAPTVPQTGEVSIAYLKSLCENRMVEIHSDITISGVVVANDWLGEYYKSFVIMDETGGIQVALDMYDIYRHIPIFSRVTIFCNGMTLGRVGGKIELGMWPTSDFIVDNIPADMVGRYIRVEGAASEPESVRRSEIGELSLQDITTVVQFDNVRVPDRGRGTWCEMVDGVWVDTVRVIEDLAGGSLSVRIRGGCDYAGDRIPDGKFSVKGIVDYSAGEYYLRIINNGIISDILSR